MKHALTDKGAAEAAPFWNAEVVLLLRLRSRIQRHVACLLRRGLILLLVRQPSFVARGGRRLFLLLGRISGQAQRPSLCLAVRNLGGVGCRWSQSVRLRSLALGLLGRPGAIAHASLLR